MSQAEATEVRKLIEEQEPIRDIELNFLLVEHGIDPHDAIVLQDILLEQERIQYNKETNCFKALWRETYIPGLGVIDFKPPIKAKHLNGESFL